MLRWRNENGIHQMANLTEIWFDKFRQDLRESGLEGLAKHRG
jgi:hypothetical protein